MRNARPYILLHDLNMDLPCLSKHWTAGSVHAWTALHPWTKECPPTDSFATCISRVVESPADAHSEYDDDYVRFIIGNVLNRLIWDNKEATTHQAALRLGTYNALLNGKDELLNILDIFTSPMHGYPCFSTKPRTELAIQLRSLVNITHGLADGAVMCDLFGIMLWHDESSAAPARRQIQMYIKDNPRHSRSLLFSTAQQVTIGRLYPCNHPQEAWNVFHAGIGVFVMSTLLAEEYSVPSTSCSSNTNLPVCNLDWQGAPDGHEAMAIRDWIQNGGPSLVRMHGVPDVLSALGARQALQQTAEVLSNMSVWGIKRVLLNAIRGLLHAGDAARTKVTKI